MLKLRKFMVMVCVLQVFLVNCFCGDSVLGLATSARIMTVELELEILKIKMLNKVGKIKLNKKKGEPIVVNLLERMKNHALSTKDLEAYKNIFDSFLELLKFIPEKTEKIVNFGEHKTVKVVPTNESVYVNKACRVGMHSKEIKVPKNFNYEKESIDILLALVKNRNFDHQEYIDKIIDVISEKEKGSEKYKKKYQKMRLQFLSIKDEEDKAFYDLLFVTIMVRSSAVGHLQALQEHLNHEKDDFGEQNKEDVKGFFGVLSKKVKDLIRNVEQNKISDVVNELSGLPGFECFKELKLPKNREEYSEKDIGKLNDLLEEIIFNLKEAVGNNKFDAKTDLNESLPSNNFHERDGDKFFINIHMGETPFTVDNAVFAIQSLHDQS